ncbi:MAG TPA: glycoside hydrolase family 3 C-terminal domain-containing protein, partial [Gemmatimonadales bacterium]|nr:glycoside hydrolase family 3 C-terminal domain-containing protein [Gemmatimonadales bacterium]
TYLPAFEAAVVEGGARSVMCAYNRVHGDPACASGRLLGEILRGEWEFDGYVVSDCWAITDIHERHRVAKDEVEAAARSLSAGTDLACGPEYRSLVEAVRRGLVTEAAIDTALTRLLRERFRLGLLDDDADPAAGVAPEVLDSEPHRALAREAAVKSLVLLKNDRGLLPLGAGVRRIAVIGPNGDDVEVLLGNYNGTPADPVTPLAGIRDAAARRGIAVRYARGADVAPGIPSLVTLPASALRDLTARYFAGHGFADGATERPESLIAHQWWRDPPLAGTPADSFSVRWTGTLVPPATGRYALGLRATGAVKQLLDDSVVVEFSDRHVVLTQWGWRDLTGGEPRRLTVEYFDRRADASVELVWAPPAPGLLEEAVAAARDADVAVLALGLSPRLEGEEMPVEVPGFAGGDRVSLDLPAPQEALLRAVHATGTPVVLVILSGSAVAIPWAAEHVPAILQAWYPGQAAGQALADVLFGDASPAGRLPVTIYRSAADLPPFDDYSMENRTYRYFRGEPLFPFGHGLSYSRFRYGDLQVPAQARAGEAVDVSVEVENAGTIPADEVVQLYVLAERPGAPEAPSPEGGGGQGVRKTLAGFRRLTLQPGEKTRVAFAVAPRAFSRVGDDGRWTPASGRYTIVVGGKQSGFRGVADAATTEVLTAAVELVR